jgi:hypothetical protein
MTGYRKWSVAVLAIVGAFWLAERGKLTSDYAMVAMASVGAYTAANAYANKRRADGLDSTYENGS